MGLLFVSEKGILLSIYNLCLKSKTNQDLTVRKKRSNFQLYWFYLEERGKRERESEREREREREREMSFS